MFVQRCLGSPELRLGKEQNVFKNRKKIKKYVEKYKKNKNKQTNAVIFLWRHRIRVRQKASQVLD